MCTKLKVRHASGEESPGQFPEVKVTGAGLGYKNILVYTPAFHKNLVLVFSRPNHRNMSNSTRSIEGHHCGLPPVGGRLCLLSRYLYPPKFFSVIIEPLGISVGVSFAGTLDVRVLAGSPGGDINPVGYFRSHGQGNIPHKNITEGAAISGAISGIDFHIELVEDLNIRLPASLFR